MLEFIRVQRFKSLVDASFSLSGLNLFSGLNGMGKSSLVQTLLLLRQSFEKNALPNRGLLLKGDYVNLGTGRDILSEHADEETFEFTLTRSDEEPQRFIFGYESASDLQPVKSAPVAIDTAGWSLFNTNFQYLAADRVSPRSMYEASDYYIRDLKSLGNHGEYSVHYIAQYGSEPLPIPALRHEKAVSLSLVENLDKWMSEISPGIRIRAELQTNVNSVSLGYVFEQGAEMTQVFKPQNVGFGLTFVLPVMVALLRSSPGDLLVIENPEAHLHPGAQAVLGRLCTIASSNGVQLFIETHSDHFLNGIRVSVKERLIAPSEVRLYYLERSSDRYHSVDIVSPEIDAEGRISFWPRGFFDEGDRQLEKLL